MINWSDQKIFGGKVIMKRVSFKEYRILKAIYKRVIVVSASDNEALIFIRK